MSEALPLWGPVIPYNSDRNKSDDMCLTKAPMPFVMLHWIQWVFGKKLQKDNHGMDDYVERTQIRKGLANPTYTDVPTITPYVVPNSRTSVVIAPGGGFCMVSTPNEGVHPAEMLNKAGISAFVINYRLEPYRFPIPCLDVQRAVRWVRSNAAEYGVNPDSVGVMGFSAGGYAVAGSAALLGNDPVIAGDYKMDAVDQQNGRPDYVITIYPVTHFEDNPNMLANLKGPEFYTDPAKRAQWMKDYSLIEQYDKMADIPQFMNYGTKDMLKGHERYAEKVKTALDVNHVEVLEGANHGYSGNEKWSSWEPVLCDWIKKVTDANQQR